MSTIDQDPRTGQSPNPENMPDINNVLPSSPDTAEAVTSRRTNRAPRRRIGLGGRIALIAAGTAAAGAAIFGGVTAANQAPSNEPIAEAPADPSNPTAPEAGGKSETLPTEAELEIPAGLSAEEVGTIVIDRYNDWYSAGSNNQAVYDQWRDEGIDADEFAINHAPEYATVFADGLFIDGWESIPELTNSYNASVESNTYNLALNLITGNPENGDIEAFATSSTIEAVRVVSSEDGVRTLEIDYVISSNSNLNRAGEFAEDGAIITHPQGTRSITLVTVGNTERIASTTVVVR